ncbi:APH(3') family aminoglycoside O-phosphotransferase [Pseudomonas canadensis]|uniref:APH(3') family aminoglycoside O-phosphotransferase n=1 Tax=Pseudomonas canadensis TaxID=915099 RepID=UPI0030DB7ECB
MNFPSQWSRQFDGATIERQMVGESGAEVFRVRGADARDLFVKSEPIGVHSELPQEIERLGWMNGLNLPGPTVLDAMTESDRHWLLMTAVPGKDLSDCASVSPTELISILATALRALHQVPVELCPFDHSLEQRIDIARSRMLAGLVDEDDFDDDRTGRTAADAFAELLASRPKVQDLAVTHGDACLPNFMMEGSRFTGYIDCGRLGISDIYQDLALAARSIERNCGAAWVAPFFRAYGVEPDHRRIAFYCLLDEFY